MSSLTNNRTAARLFLEEIWSKGNAEVAEKYLTPDFLFVLPADPFETKGIERFLWLVNRNRNAFQDLTYTPLEVVAEEDKAIAYWTMTSIHVGLWAGIEPTNKQVSIKGTTLFRFSPEGKISEVYVLNDQLRLQKQLGVIPGEANPPVSAPWTNYWDSRPYIEKQD